MQSSSLEKLGGLAMIVGALLFAAYSSLYLLLLPVSSAAPDFVQIVRHPAWLPLAITAFAGIVLMLIGFYVVYARIRDKAGILGVIGFLVIEATYFLQGCKVTWEIFLYPVIAAHAESAFLLSEAIIKNDPSVVLFRSIASLTIFVGVVLFCLALFRSRQFKRTAPVLIFVGAIAYAIGPFFSLSLAIAGILVFAVGCLLLGAEIMRPHAA